MTREWENLAVNNLLWLREHFPQTYEAVRSRKADSDNYRLTKSRSGRPNLEVSHAGKWTPLYSQYNPEQEAKRWAAQRPLPQRGEVLLIGLGLGYHLQALSETHPTLQVYLYEPDPEVLLHALEVFPLYLLPRGMVRSFGVGPFLQRGTEEKLEKVSTGAGTGVNGAVMQQRQALTASFYTLARPLVSKMIARPFELVVIPPYRKVYTETVVWIEETLERVVEAERVSLHTNLNFEQRWTVNALRNAPYTLRTPSTEAFRERLAGKPLVIVSSGPSMDAAVDVLKAVRDAVFILAAGSSVNGLLYHGLAPHAMVSYDPAPGNKKVFDLMAEKYRTDIPFIAGTTIFHEILEEYTFPYLFHAIISQDTITNALLAEIDPGRVEPVFQDAPSIAVVALQLAHDWGANPILLVGQDLAFPEHKYYAAGVSHNREQVLSEEELKQYFEVEQVGGGRVLTSKSLNRMRENMEVFIKRYGQEDGQTVFINTSPCGARIEGTVEIPLAEAVERYGGGHETGHGTDSGTSSTYDAWLRRLATEDARKVSQQEAEALLGALWQEQGSLDAAMEKLQGWLQAWGPKDDRVDWARAFQELDRYMKELEKVRLYRLIYKPMMRTELNLYSRMAQQLKFQPNDREKFEKTAARVYGVLRRFQQTKQQL